MPIGPVQRYPQGLLDVLALKGVTPPQLLSDELQGQIELLQFLGLTQRQVLFANNAAAAEGVTVSTGLPAGAWGILFFMSGSFTKTATMTALRGTLFINRGGLSIAVASQELGPFGATESGVCSVTFAPAYPLLLPPGSTLLSSAQVIGTDATAAIGVQAEVGLLA